MAKFVFKFAAVLKQRKVAEDMARRALAEVLGEQQRLFERLRRTQSAIAASKRELSGALRGRVDVLQIGSFARYSSQVSAEGRAVVQEAASLQPRIDAARARLIDAAKARRAMELLRDRHLAEWKREMGRRETIELDEIGAQAYVRSRAAATVHASDAEDAGEAGEATA